MILRPIYAHSLPDRPPEAWEPLPVHLHAVAQQAAARAESFGWAKAGEVMGLLHDIGKASAEFQAYLAGNGPSVDHSTAGAIEAASAYSGRIGDMIALIVAGHHAGLGDWHEIERRLASRPSAYAGWEAAVGPLPTQGALRNTKTFLPPPDWIPPGFTLAFLTRMLFSCLVDSDFIATETFMQGVKNRGTSVSLCVLRDRLSDHLAGLPGEGNINRLRRSILDHVVARADAAPGFFTLCVPTGGGKTFASLAFALHHACKKKKRRVVVVAPFTTVIEQTAAAYRIALGHPEAVLQHHAAFDWEEAGRRGDAGDEQDGLGRLRRAAENWDAPVVVTTAVQFFESLYANRSSRCRKLHNLADSVIILDEAQATPRHVLQPCLAALDELQRNYGATIVICTATQPAWRVVDGALFSESPGGIRTEIGLPIENDRELAPDPPALHEQLRRTRVEVLEDEVDDRGVAAAFAEGSQMLCIVNSRGHARALFETIRRSGHAVHLSTLMCPAHRETVLAKVKADLKDRRPVWLVSTSLVEAGVDFSFPTVWRASTGLDSIAQAAGRCNREGELSALGRVVVFRPAGRTIPRDLRVFEEATRAALRGGADPLAPATLTRYFRELYFHCGMAALDNTPIVSGGGMHVGVLAAIRASEPPRVPFRSIGENFRLIDQAMQPVLVPYDENARSLLDRLRFSTGPMGGLLRDLQRYVVPIPAANRSMLLGQKVLKQVRPELGDAIVELAASDYTTMYRSSTGFDLSNGAFRTSEDNIIA